MGCGAVDVLWSFLSLSFLLAFLLHRLSSHFPIRLERSQLFHLFQDLIRYGKTKQLQRGAGRRSWGVPKRWFWHFYAVSVCWNGLLLFLSLNVTLRNQLYPLWVTSTLEFLTGTQWDESRVLQLSTLLVQLLLWLHSLRRLCECLLVSVYSPGVLHLVQYVFGLGYYIVLGLTVLCSNPLGDREGVGSLLSRLEWHHVAGTFLFLWASLLQHRSLVLLARLRTQSSGAVKTLEHRVPNGGWFHLVSCPHYFAELLIYVSLGLVFGGRSFSWWLVVTYVLFNQALAAQLCHEFYISKFELYPRQRFAYIPFLL